VNYPQHDANNPVKGQCEYVTEGDERTVHPEENVLQGLLLRARQGDRAAFDCLQQRLESGVLRFIRRLIGGISQSEETIQDAAREVFLALYLNLHRLSAPAMLRPFAYRVARNLCYDELRRRGRYDMASLEAMPDEGTNIPTPGPGIGETVERLYLWSEVHAAIERLPEFQRQALILYSEEDLSYAEIAEVMVTDIGTIRSRLFHARQGLIRRLRPEVLEAFGIVAQSTK
jgi:RNA polymerase sigma-70 factor (ECF subfamily)